MYFKISKLLGILSLEIENSLTAITLIQYLRIEKYLLDLFISVVVHSELYNSTFSLNKITNY